MGKPNTKADSIRRNAGKPCWKIYKNDFCIGQALSWHIGLNVLMVSENKSTVELHKIGNYVQIMFKNDTNRYRIQKEDA